MSFLRPLLRRLLSVTLLLPLWTWAAFEPEAQSPDFILDTAYPRLDTDGDGMVDTWELNNGLNPNLDDSLGNPDGDSYTNIEEYNADFDPHVAESDGVVSGRSALFVVDIREVAPDQDDDEMPNEWEILYGLDPAVDDAASDPDADGMTNLEEYNGGWNPNVADKLTDLTAESADCNIDTGAYPLGFSTDTDNDGMPDWWEDKYGLNRTVNDADENPDGDELTNIEEYLTGRVPDKDDQSGEVSTASAVFSLDTAGRKVDSDGDGMPDEWENLYGLDPAVADADQDPDNDGMTNLEEYNGGWNPVTAEDTASLSAVSGLFIVDTGAYPPGFSYDIDEDGMPDWWEIKYGLSVTTTDGDGNPDGDSRTNVEEYRMGSDPTAFDYEALVLVGRESNYFTLDTSGTFVDNDLDSIPDSWERKIIDANDYDAITEPEYVDPDSDFDNDGVSNRLEYAFCLDPTTADETNGQQVSVTEDPYTDDQHVEVTVHVRSDDAALNYVVQTCPDLELADWTGGTLDYAAGQWTSSDPNFEITTQTEASENPGQWTLTIRVPDTARCSFFRVGVE